MPGYAGEEYRPRLAFVGRHLKVTKDSLFTSAELELQGLEDWAAITGFNIKFQPRAAPSEGGYEVFYKNPTPIVIDGDGIKITISCRANLPLGVRRQLRIPWPWLLSSGAVIFSFFSCLRRTVRLHDRKRNKIFSLLACNKRDSRSDHLFSLGDRQWSGNSGILERWNFRRFGLRSILRSSPYVCWLAKT